MHPYNPLFIGCTGAIIKIPKDIFSLAKSYIEKPVFMPGFSVINGSHYIMKLDADYARL